jgi:HEAT repeat protein
LQHLADPNERIRADSAVQLGRLKAHRAVDPLTATLAGDQSPLAREAAARALGLIGDVRAMPALRRAAQVDIDATVRSSATFAIDVIQTRR